MSTGWTRKFQPFCFYSCWGRAIFLWLCMTDKLNCTGIDVWMITSRWSNELMGWETFAESMNRNGTLVKTKSRKRMDSPALFRCVGWEQGWHLSSSQLNPLGHFRKNRWSFAWKSPSSSMALPATSSRTASSFSKGINVEFGWQKQQGSSSSAMWINWTNFFHNLEKNTWNLLTGAPVVDNEEPSQRRWTWAITWW